MDVNPNFNEMKAARSDKPQSPNTTKFGEGMLPEQIIAINNPDFILNTEDAGYLKTLGDPSNKGVFKNKRNTSHMVGDKSYNKNQNARLAAQDPSQI